MQTNNVCMGLFLFFKHSSKSSKQPFGTYPILLNHRDVVLDPKRKYPFRAVIKVVRYGTMYGFKFFPPNTPITQEDRDNFEYYKRNKYKKNR